MIEVQLKVLWDCDRNLGAMESCYKLYTWINDTVLMLLLQIFWKANQISDFFKQKSVQDENRDSPFIFSPLTKQSKLRRHIRSMSDVQNSTPYKLPLNMKMRGATLPYDSDTKARRLKSYSRHRFYDSSDSSDSFDAPKQRSIEYNIMKHSDSMRIL